ncbi:MAG: sigma-70 family RNA polymerase sigma factor [Leptospirales bacterium]|nr:sigma-70 family RNA polymerase sigma factor [Leptospirales bacterium]
MSGFRKTAPHGDLSDLPSAYWKNQDLNDLLAGVSDFFVRFVRARLSPEPDVVGEFYLYMQPRFSALMERYRARQDAPFRAYLAAYLRLEFRNFQRSQRSPLEYFLDTEFVEETIRAPDSEALAPAVYRDQEQVRKAVEDLPTECRLPLKLYHGFQLNLEDLRSVADCSTHPAAAASFLEKYHQRRAQAAIKSDQLQRSAIRLQRWKRAASDESIRGRWRQARQRVLQRLHTERGVLSVQEISELVGVSKSTIARRMERALNLMRQTLTGGICQAALAEELA